MSRRSLVLLLLSAQAATLLTGCRTVLMAESPRPLVRVMAPVAVAPAPTSLSVVTTKAAPIRRTVPRAKPKARAARPPAARASAKRRTAESRPRAASRPLTGRLLVLAAVARIPGYVPGSAQWVVTTKHGSWGLADWYRGIVYISPRVPSNRIYDVVSHEWSHLASVRPYPSVDDAIRAMNRVFGGTGLTGPERAADCMARQLGATWTHYTDCTRAEWRAAARRLLAGQPA